MDLAHFDHLNGFKSSFCEMQFEKARHDLSHVIPSRPMRIQGLGARAIWNIENELEFFLFLKSIYQFISLFGGYSIIFLVKK